MSDTAVRGPQVREGSAALGALLLAGSCLPVLGAVLIAPVVPAMRDAFRASDPGSDPTALVLVAQTIPALFIALLSPAAGALADRVGRRNLLLAAFVAYALVGTAPLWLSSLPAIVVSRALVGITEAAVITCCTTLLGDVFSGARRDRYLGLQVVVTSLAATVFFGLGGGIGSGGWRRIFWAYAISIVLAAVAAVLVPRVARNATPPGPEDGAEAGAAIGTTDAAPPVLDAGPWRAVLLPCALTLVSSILFYVVPVHMSLVLDAQGVKDSAAIGAITAVAALATAIGGFLAGRLAAGRIQVLLPVEYAVVAVGLIVLGLSGSSTPLATVAAVVAGVGAGLLLPTLLIWTMSLLAPAQRGRGTGAWSAAFFLGQFLCPLVVLAIGGGSDGLFRGIGVVGAIGAVMAVVSLRVRRAAPLPA